MTVKENGKKKERKKNKGCGDLKICGLCCDILAEDGPWHGSLLVANLIASMYGKNIFLMKF